MTFPMTTCLFYVSERQPPSFTFGEYLNPLPSPRAASRALQRSCTVRSRAQQSGPGWAWQSPKRGTASVSMGFFKSLSPLPSFTSAGSHCSQAGSWEHFQQCQGRSLSSRSSQSSWGTGRGRLANKQLTHSSLAHNLPR